MVEGTHQSDDRISNIDQVDSNLEFSNNFSEITEEFWDHANLRWLDVFNKAQDLSKSWKQKEALPYAEFAVQSDPKNAYNLQLLASIYDSFGNSNKATIAIDKAARLAPENMYINYDAARIHVNANMLSEAKLYIIKTINLDSNNWFNQYQAAKIYEKLWEYDQALTHIQHCLKIWHFPNHSHYMHWLILLWKKDYNNSAKALLASIKLENQNSLTLWVIAKLIFEAEEKIDNTVADELKNYLNI